MSIVSVLLPLPLAKALSYKAPAELPLAPGDYVRVPFRQGEKVGVVWAIDQKADIDPKKIKYVIEKIELPAMPKVQRDFIDWIAQYTLSDKGAVLKLTMSASGAFEPPSPDIGYRLKDDPPDEKLTDKQQHVVNAIADGLARKQTEIAREAGVSASVVKSLLDKGILEEKELYPRPPCNKPDLEGQGPILSEAQATASATICKAIEDKSQKTFLLDGVTGAGKTEVYFEAVISALKQNRQVLILLPEIALSNAFLSRFRERFGCDPALWHSALSPGRRKTTWRAVARGQTKVVIGARSALMLPYADLGLIIVDEEHDPAYKQEDGVLYNARDMAVLRGHKGGFPVVLVSATPSLETIANAWAERYEQLHLPERHGGATMPDIHLIDMREDKPERQKFLSPTLKSEIHKRMEQGTQSLLFLNRRGYAPLTLCRSCGHRFECPRCTAWLVEHRFEDRLNCHHCGYMTPVPETCPQCSDRGSLAACGPGVERILEEVKLDFPKARTLVLSSDTAEDHDELKAALQKIHDEEVDIIIGTQIIAKGHHFPKLALVGVIDADLGLGGGDLRAAERTYQLLHQVAGRAGRAEISGEVYLQTFSPDNRVMQALQNGERDMFLEIEADQRKNAHMPPYSRLAGVIISSTKESEADGYANMLAEACPEIEGVHILGPAPAPIYRLRGRYRKRFLAIADKSAPIQKTLADWLNAHKPTGDIRVAVDIDPQSFL